MSDVLQIGKAFKSLISEMSVGKQLKDRIFPLVAMENTPFPYIVYSRVSTRFEGTKDSYYQIQTPSVELAICGGTYTQSLDIARAIKDEMPGGEVSIGSFEISSIQLTDASERFQDNTYMQILQYEVEMEG